MPDSRGMGMRPRERSYTVKGSEVRSGMTILRLADAHLIRSLAEEPAGSTAYFGLDDFGHLGGYPLLLEGERTCSGVAGGWELR